MNINTQPILSEPEYIFDEKRKVVVNARDLNQFQFDIYRRSMYKRQRPDLTDYDYLVWKEKYRLGEHYLTQMRIRVNYESQRYMLQGHSARNKENNKYFEKDILALSQPHIRGPRYHIERTWEEASKIVAYMDKISNRIQNYFLHYPAAYPQITKQKCEQIEDELTEKFIREMRKPPAARATEEAAEE